MANRFQKRRRRSVPMILFIIVLFASAIAVFELYRWIIPFHAENPLFQEVTIGENVISNWKYGGESEEGYLRFYNNAQTIVLPPDSHLFDADGQFVVLEHYSPSSLTYAYPIEAVPFKWYVAGAAVLGLFIGGIYYRFKYRPRKLVTRKQPLIHSDDAIDMWQRMKPHSKAKRFQPKSSKSKWKL